MKLSIIGDTNDLIHSDTHYFVNCNKLDLEIKDKESKLKDVDVVLIQADCHDVDKKLEDVLIKLDAFFISLKKRITIVISFKLINFHSINKIYTNYETESLNIAFITSIKENHKKQNRDKWIIEIHPVQNTKEYNMGTECHDTLCQSLVHLQKKSTNSDSSNIIIFQSVPNSEETKNTVENLLHLLHYELEIDHKHTSFISKNALSTLNKYIKNIQKVKKRFIKELKEDTLIDLTEKTVFFDLLEHMIIV